MPSNLPTKPTKPSKKDKAWSNLKDLPKELSNLRLDHIGIAVKDLDEASKPYLALGLEAVFPDEVIAEQAVKVRVFRLNGVGLELLQASGKESPIAKFIEKRTEGLHHIALQVADIEHEYKRLLNLGASFIGDEIRKGHNNSRIIFLHPKWARGTLIELVEHE